MKMTSEQYEKLKSLKIGLSTLEGNIINSYEATKDKGYLETQELIENIWLEFNEIFTLVEEGEIEVV
jgi:hypothetical protein